MCTYVVKGKTNKVKCGSAANKKVIYRCQCASVTIDLACSNHLNPMFSAGMIATPVLTIPTTRRLTASSRGNESSSYPGVLWFIIGLERMISFNFDDTTPRRTGDVQCLSVLG